MSQSASLYEIDQKEFDRLSNNPGDFRIERTLANKTFDQNFEGLRFLLEKFTEEENKELVFEIFNPSGTLGESPNFEGFELMELDDFAENSISYLSPEKVKMIHHFLSQVDEKVFLDKYNPKELNESGIYPGIWHNNDSPDLAFNKRDLREGLLSLQALFKSAATRRTYIVAFIG